ncbi:putative T7SS-secreted protein [Saccharopolyspora erythraea]|uniref:Putative T7SS secretion signal domain-containing protein n=2 Tax=Saccharopolyspora erythraea TaxID=1836 RepID=A4FBU1_SACEN|nr:hypothetical protein [Saccharopolyspora erythraea]EQD87561.1 hypothetical protein N599_04110 [Saccharopolyspora erythraea D]QRK91939.1 hypothetical protein JQX30_11585 [Saccharopolyspora erythraea]CAM01516.1 hypothetical protein SACE_2210 [Saccharopolyspora erythraea NRRL 2338]
MNSLGSELKYLGQVTGLVEEDLIPGDPAVAEELAAHLMKLGAAFEKAGEGFKRIDAGGWEGKAADAAREYLTATLPPRWLAAADAHTEAGTAVQDYARVLADAKARAEQAKQALDRANAESEKARLAHNAAVERYNADPGAGAAPPECSDPGAQARAQAEREIAAAKAAVADADLRAARIVGRAMEAAPAEPGMLAQLAANAEDLVQGLGAGVGSLVGGAVDAVVGLGTTVVGAVGFMTTYGNPAWTMTHPQEFAQFNAQVDGLVKAAATDPAGFGYQVGKTMLNVEGWKNDPLRAAGEMVPDAVGSIVGGAGIASRVGRSVGKVGDVAGDLGKTAGRVDGVPRHTPEPPPRPQPPAPQPRPEPPAPQQQPRPEHPSAQPRQQAPSPQQPSSPTTPWGDYNDLPPSTAHHAPPDTTPSWGQPEPSYPTRPDGGFGPMGSAQEVVEQAPRYAEKVDRTSPWQGDFDNTPSGPHERPTTPTTDPLDRIPEPEVPTHRNGDHENGPDQPGHHDGHDDPPGHGRDDPSPRGDGDRPGVDELFPEPGAPFDEGRALHTFREALDGQYGDLTVAVKEVSGNAGSYRMVADILDANGQPAGTAIRDFYRLDDGGLSVTHNKLEIHDPELRGSGFAGEFNGKLEDWYRKSGVEEIRLQANIDVGSYAWARQGYEFANHAQAVQHILPRLHDEIARAERDLAGLHDQLRQPDAEHGVLSKAIDHQEKLLRSAREIETRFHEGSDKFPTPWEISNLGRPEGLKPGESRDLRWPGKDVLQDPSGRENVMWHGVKKL